MTSRLALGTAQFGMPYGIAGNPLMPESEMAAILDHAKAQGITMVDTAPVYGEAEARLGRYGMWTRDLEWQVISKLPPIPYCYKSNYVGEWVRAIVRASLINLKLPRLHALLLHRPWDLMGPHRVALTEALLLLKTQGLVSHLGVSIEGPEQLHDLLQIFPVEIVQAPFNVLDRRLADSGWLARLHTKGITVHVRSVFLQGLLLMQHRTDKFKKWHDVFGEWSRFCGNHGIGPMQGCLEFVLQYQEIERIVIGVDSVLHLEDVVDTITPRRYPPFLYDPSVQPANLDLITPSRWSQL